jgi:hypothetical protein
VDQKDEEDATLVDRQSSQRIDRMMQRKDLAFGDANATAADLLDPIHTFRLAREPEVARQMKIHRDPQARLLKNNTTTVLIRAYVPTETLKPEVRSLFAQPSFCSSIRQLIAFGPHTFRVGFSGREHVLDDANQLMSSGGDGLRYAQPPLHLLIELTGIILVLECARLDCFRPIRLTVRSNSGPLDRGF